MITKKYLWPAFILVFSYFTGYSQISSHRLHSLTITKIVNDEFKRISKYIQIDSLGNIYNGGKEIDEKLDIQSLCKGIDAWIISEKIDKRPGSNDIYFVEIPVPKLNEQYIRVSIIFLEDFNREKNLRNKTSYDWGKVFNQNNNNYVLYKYLNDSEIRILKALLE